MRVWKQVRETGKEGLQEEDRRLLEEEGYGRGNRQIRGRELEGKRRRGERDTQERRRNM